MRLIFFRKADKSKVEKKGKSRKSGKHEQIDDSHLSEFAIQTVFGTIGAAFCFLVASLSVSQGAHNRGRSMRNSNGRSHPQIDIVDTQFMADAATCRLYLFPIKKHASTPKRQEGIGKYWNGSHGVW